MRARAAALLVLARPQGLPRAVLPVHGDRVLEPVAAVVAALGRREDGLVLRAELLRSGVSRARLRRALDRGEVVEVRPGVVSLVRLPALPRHLDADGGRAYAVHVRAVLLSLGPPCAARSRSAVVLHRAALLRDPQQVEVVVPHERSRLHALPGVDVRRTRRTLPVEPVRGSPRGALRVVSPLAAVHGMAHERPRAEAVAALDSLRRDGLLSSRALAAAARHGLLSDPQGRGVLARSDPASGSVLESAARCLFVDAGLLGFLTQHEVRDEHGRFVARADFAWPHARLLVEVDGARWHPDPARDRWRDAASLGCGWRVLRFTWSDVLQRPEEVIEAVRRALAASSPAPAA